jgi:hypothetical protein
MSVRLKWRTGLINALHVSAWGLDERQYRNRLKVPGKRSARNNSATTAVIHWLTVDDVAGWADVIG